MYLELEYLDTEVFSWLLSLWWENFFFIPHLCNTKYLLYLGYHLVISTLSFHASIFHNRTGYSFSLVFGHHLLSNESETKAGEQLMGHDLETVQFSS